MQEACSLHLGETLSVLHSEWGWEQGGEIQVYPKPNNNKMNELFQQISVLLSCNHQTQNSTYYFSSHRLKVSLKSMPPIFFFFKLKIYLAPPQLAQPPQPLWRLGQFNCCSSGSCLIVLFHKIKALTSFEL